MKTQKLFPDSEKTLRNRSARIWRGKGLRKIKPSLFILSTHLYEIGANLKQYSNIQFKYFETSVHDGELVFHYHLKEGISDDRLGYLILKREGVVDLLQNL